MRCTSIRGFTLVESVIVLVVASILSAVVISSFEPRAQHSVLMQADQFRRDLAHAQVLAISKGMRLRFVISSSGYAVRTCTSSSCATHNALVDPATGQNFGATFKDGAALTPTTPLDFDSLGRPQIASAATYTMSGSGESSGISVAISIAPVTGFIQAN